MPDLPSGRFFGFYLQFHDRRDGEREQFLVLPPVSLEIPRKSGRVCWWERKQSLAKQRPAWKFQVEGGTWPTFQQRVNSRLASVDWMTGGPWVTRVTEAEVKDWIRLESTPYDFIRKLERRTQRHNVQIAGPTFMPQAVAR